MTKVSAAAAAEVFEVQRLTQALGLIGSPALTIWGEARNLSPDGQIAVGQVIMHRLTTGRWGTTVSDVVGARLQFSCWWRDGGKENAEAVHAMAGRVLAEGFPRELRQCQWIAQGLMGNLITDDLVHGATHYMTKALWQTKKVKWAIGLMPVAHVGNHVFFAGVK